MIDARFVVVPVAGAPYQPKDYVRVVAATDASIYNVSQHIGKIGVVQYLDYSETVGQQFPHDPMVNVLLEDGREEHFWREELCACTPGIDIPKVFRLKIRQPEEGCDDEWPKVLALA